jgi:hypothetical protein
LGQTFPLISTKNYTGQDFVVIVVIGLVYKMLYIVGVLYKTSQVAKFHDEAYVPPAPKVTETPAATAETMTKAAMATSSKATPKVEAGAAAPSTPAIKPATSYEKYEEPSEVTV